MNIHLINNIQCVYTVQVKTVSNIPIVQRVRYIEYLFINLYIHTIGGYLCICIYIYIYVCELYICTFQLK